MKLRDLLKGAKGSAGTSPARPSQDDLDSMLGKYGIEYEVVKAGPRKWRAFVWKVVEDSEFGNYMTDDFDTKSEAAWAVLPIALDMLKKGVRR